MSFFNPFRSAAKPARQEAEAGAAPGQPLELIAYDTSTGHFRLGSPALDVLRQVPAPSPHSHRLSSPLQQPSLVSHASSLPACLQIQGPVGVVAVCGRARQGKSFILNQLLGQSKLSHVSLNFQADGFFNQTCYSTCASESAPHSK